jgi:hypothetical protein
MVEFHFQPDSKEKVLAAFELQGPNRNPGVKFRGAWIGTRSDMAFVLAESDDQALIEKVAQSWSQYGSYQIHPVVEVENY